MQLNVAFSGLCIHAICNSHGLLQANIFMLLLSLFLLLFDVSLSKREGENYGG